MIGEINIDGPSEELSKLLTFLMNPLILGTVRACGIRLTRSEREPGMYYRDPYPLSLCFYEVTATYDTYLIFKLSVEEQRMLIDTLRSKLEDNGSAVQVQ